MIGRYQFSDILGVQITIDKKKLVFTLIRIFFLIRVDPVVVLWCNHLGPWPKARDKKFSQL